MPRPGVGHHRGNQIDEVAVVAHLARFPALGVRPVGAPDQPLRRGRHRGVDERHHVVIGVAGPGQPLGAAQLGPDMRQADQVEIDLEPGLIEPLRHVDPAEMVDDDGDRDPGDPLRRLDQLLRHGVQRHRPSVSGDRRDHPVEHRELHPAAGPGEQRQPDAARALLVERAVVRRREPVVRLQHRAEPPVGPGDGIERHAVVEAVPHRLGHHTAVDAEEFGEVDVMLERRGRRHVGLGVGEGEPVGRTHDVEVAVAGPFRQAEIGTARVGNRRIGDSKAFGHARASVERHGRGVHFRSPPVISTGWRAPERIWLRGRPAATLRGEPIRRSGALPESPVCARPIPPGRCRVKRSILVVAALAACAAVSSGALAQKTFTMKIGMPTINDSNHFSALWVKKEVEAKSKGRIQVRVFPAGQLGKIPRQIEGIQLGTQEAFNIPPGFFVGIERAFMVTDAPGIFEDIGHAHRAVNHPPFREKFGKLGAKKGFTANYLWACGNTSIATIAPFKTLEDIKGRKIRVLATPLERAFISKLGATGVPMPYTEVLPAMQQRVIDGVRSAVIVMYRRSSTRSPSTSRSPAWRR